LLNVHSLIIYLGNLKYLAMILASYLERNATNSLWKGESNGASGWLPEK
jgi:hypothetical protein